MKKNYIYFLVPLVALVLFAVRYLSFNSEYEKKEQAKVVAADKAKKDKLEALNRDRQKAYEDATAANERRKKEKEAKEKYDAEQAEARDLALEGRNKALRDANTLTQKIDHLTKDVDAAKKEVAAVEQQQKQAADEKVFLLTYVKQAQDSSKGLESVLQKIKDADDAAVAAAKAAADAAKAAKK